MEQKIRCTWCEGNSLYIDYHDTEWGKFTYEENTLFEFLILEGFQAGLSWLTILKKRDDFRKAFDDFDPMKVASYDERKVEELLSNERIIRNKLKVQAAINNAKRFIEIQEEYTSFGDYLKRFVPNPIDNYPDTLEDVPSQSPLSDLLSKDLKKRGFKFVGTTIIYSFLQATGRINDHLKNCFTRE
ncbi:DNA-3-methyladenine glycosylase I [Capnocytophaga sp. G2]|jgi:DNA-3-methyladenine glycosylase 1|uniref:DNA-3-methyladenine glycosylase I n=1 Tax=Capnocytophaga sp. G2 TaxID=3110695 RepID=UPI002B463E41|nr:DNA-3-methyladenine glycosylase I [Capnocytophaga sp. G2]MEB3005237.1 DNA-3-methyladenine glycosylase I [Capnocytophaga sp. G2]